MPFEDWSKVADGPLVLSIYDKKYTIPPVVISAGVELLDVVQNPNGPAAKKVDEDAVATFRQILGSAYDVMVRDKVPFPAVQRAASTALVDFLYGRTAAESVWAKAELPEALAGKTPAKSTAGGSTTRSRASGTGTSTRRAASRKK